MYDNYDGEQVGCWTEIRRSIPANLVGAFCMFGAVENIIHGGDMSPLPPAESVLASISTLAIAGSNMIDSVAARLRRR